MSSILGLIRIAAVVGLSAIKVISTCVKIKEAKEQGVINPFMHVINNSNPYKRPMPMNNNMMCGSSMNMNQCYNQELRWRDETFGMSRRNMVVPQTPVTVPVHHVVTPVTQVVPVPTPTPVVTQPVYQQPVVNTTTMNNFDSRRWNTIPVNVPMTNNYQTPIINQIPNMNTELKWRDTVSGVGIYNNSNINYPFNGNNIDIGELQWKPLSRHQPDSWYHNQNITCYQPPPQRPWKPIFNWDLLKNNPFDRPKGVVAMFYTDDGVPLFGPTPVT